METTAMLAGQLSSEYHVHAQLSRMVDRWHVDARHSRENTRVPFGEALTLLAEVLDDGARIWESFAIRAFGSVSRHPSTELIVHHLHVEGCFDHDGIGTFGELLAAPPIWGGSVDAARFQSVLEAWATGSTGTIAGVALRLPVLSDVTFAWLAGSSVRQYVGVRPLCGQAFGEANNWWVLTAGPLTTDNDSYQLQNDLLSGGRRVGIDHASDFLLEYLGRDVTHVSGPGMSVVLPGAFRGKVEWSDDDAVCLTVGARRAVGLRECWASAALGAWTLQHERSDRWDISDGDQYWETGAQNLTVADGSRVYVGRGAFPELVLDLPTRRPVSRSLGRPFLESLYARAQGRSISQVLAPPRFDRKSAQALEGLVLSVFALADLPAIDLGAEFQMPGIDLVALDTQHSTAHVVSVTLGHDVGKKARDLAGARSAVGRLLSGWSLNSVVISATPAKDLSQREIAEAASLSVVVIGREGFEAILDDPSNLRHRLSQP